MRVLITGAAGNLGSLFARYLLGQTAHALNLMVHRTPIATDLGQDGRTRVFRCDLADPKTLSTVCAQSDVIVHFAGVLFAPHPERFLPMTNFLYTRHLVDAAIAGGVKRFILISFPHVEGPTSRKHPCVGRQDQQPISVHAQTRLAAERYLMEQAKGSAMTGIALRPGMIYGGDVLMISFAKRLARRNLLGVWRWPTPIHVLSLDDFMACCRAAIERPTAKGMYPLGDDDPTTLQEFLDAACRHWRFKKPWRVPVWSVYMVAWLCEALASLFRARTPFTVDFIRIGRVPYFCDTHRMKAELLPELQYPSLKEGMAIL